MDCHLGGLDHEEHVESGYQIELGDGFCCHIGAQFQPATGSHRPHPHDGAAHLYFGHSHAEDVAGTAFR